MLTYRMFRLWEDKLSSFALTYDWSPGENVAVCYRLPTKDKGWKYDTDQNGRYIARTDNHVVPDESCACGFHGIMSLQGLYDWFCWTPTPIVTPRRGGEQRRLQTFLSLPGYALAVIWQYGKLIIHEDGWVRSDRARILALGKVLAHGDTQVRLVSVTPPLSTRDFVQQVDPSDDLCLDPIVVEERLVVVPELAFQKYGVPYHLAKTPEELEQFFQEVITQYESHGYREVL